MDKRVDDVVETLALLAPGSDIRHGIERIIGASRGALIVVGWNATVESLVSGGFVIDAKLTAQRLSELAKMDGAIVLDSEATRVLRANVHLVPDPTIITTETGTRHRTAERTAKQTQVPVISVSESMRIVTLYLRDRKRTLENVGALLQKANQALSTLERYRNRFDEVAATLSAREVDNTVVLRDALVVLQRMEMVKRIAEEVEDFVAELGSEGRLIRLQLEELMSNVDEERSVLVQDYMVDRRRKVTTPLNELDVLLADDLLDLEPVALALGWEDGADLDQPIDVRGFRQLSRIPRLPDQIVARLVQHFGSLERLLAATDEDLVAVEGIGDARAQVIQDNLRRIANAAGDQRWL